MPAAPAIIKRPRINGASDVFVEIFDKEGRHVRAAIGVSALPRNALVQLQMTVEVGERDGSSLPFRARESSPNNPSFAQRPDAKLEFCTAQQDAKEGEL